MLRNFSRFSTLLTTSSRYDEYKFRWNDGKTLKRWNKGEIDKAGKKERQRKRNKWDETFHSCNSSRTQEQQLLFKKNSFYFCVCVCERKRERERERGFVPLPPQFFTCAKPRHPSQSEGSCSTWSALAQVISRGGNAQFNLGFWRVRVTSK